MEVLKDNISANPRDDGPLAGHEDGAKVAAELWLSDCGKVTGKVLG